MRARHLPVSVRFSIVTVSPALWSSSSDLHCCLSPFCILSSLELAKKTRAEQEDTKLETKQEANSRIAEYVTERLNQRQLAPNQAEPSLDSSYNSQFSFENLLQGRAGGLTGASANDLFLARLQQQGMGVHQDQANILESGGLQGSSIFSGMGGGSSEGINQQQLLLLQQLQLQQQQAASMVNPYFPQLQLLQEERQLQQYQLQLQQLQLQAACQAQPPNSVNPQLQYQLLLLQQQQLEREQSEFTIQREFNNNGGSLDNTEKK